jgi:ASC-1-like (ASCH) protein
VVKKMTSTSSFKQFSLENDMEDVTPDTASMDSIYKHNTEEQRTLLNAKPWSSEYIPFLTEPPF